MGRDTIEHASEQEINTCLEAVKIQATYYLEKTEFNERELKFMRHVAEVMANKNKWIDFYQNILHEPVVK